MARCRKFSWKSSLVTGRESMLLLGPVKRSSSNHHSQILTTQEDLLKKIPCDTSLGCLGSAQTVLSSSGCPIVESPICGQLTRSPLIWLNTAKDMAVASKRIRPVSCTFLATEISTVAYRAMRSLKVIYSLKSRLVTKDGISEATWRAKATSTVTERGLDYGHSPMRSGPRTPLRSCCASSVPEQIKFRGRQFATAHHEC